MQSALAYMLSCVCVCVCVCMCVCACVCQYVCACIVNVWVCVVDWGGEFRSFLHTFSKKSISITDSNALQHNATNCNALQHHARNCKKLQHTVTHCNTLQHTATHCNTLQHTAVDRKDEFRPCLHTLSKNSIS